MYMQLMKNTKNDLDLMTESLEREKLFIKGHCSKISCMSVSLDQQYIVTGSGSEFVNRQIRVWNVYLRTQAACFIDYPSEILYLAISPDNFYIVCGSSNYYIDVYNLLSQQKEFYFLDLSIGQINCLYITKESNLISISGSEYIIYWNLISKNREKVLKIDYKKDLISKISSNFIALSLENGRLNLFNHKSKTSREITLHNTKISCIDISYDSKLLITGSVSTKDKTSSISIWDIEKEKIKTCFDKLSATQVNLFIHANKNFIVSLDEKFCICGWDLLQKNLVYFIEPKGNPISCMALIQDYIVTGYGKDFSSDKNYLKLSSLQTGCHEFIFEGHCGDVTCIRILKHRNCKQGTKESSFNYGNYIATGSFDKTIRCWDLKQKKQLGVLEGHTEWVSCINITHDYKYLASGSGDKSVRVWNIEDFRQIAIIDNNSNWIEHVFIVNKKFVLFNTFKSNVFKVWDFKMKTVKSFNIEYRPDSDLNIKSIAVASNSKYGAFQLENNYILIYKIPLL